MTKTHNQYKMSENNKVIFFVGTMCIIVAGVLAGLRGATFETVNQNAAVFNQRAILKSMDSSLPTPVAQLSDEEVQEIFATKMAKSIVVDYEGNVVEGRTALDVDLAEEKKKPEEERVLPFFVYEDGGDKYYILSLRGNGLWDAIWGYISLRADLETVAGASFDHAGETPGLGAEIKDNQAWVNQFAGTKAYRDGAYLGIVVRKGGAKDDTFEVDGLSGATVTADGVDDMLEKYFAYYEPYLKKIKGGSQMGMK